MVVATSFYNPFYTASLNADIDWGADTFKMALATSTYTPNIDAHDFFDDITNEVVGTGYTAGGETLTTVTVTEDDTNDRTIVDFDDVEWANSTLTARYGILYKSTGVAATSALVCYIDFGADFSSSGTPFRIEVDATGFLTLSQAP